jgi:hypothetical protein
VNALRLSRKGNNASEFFSRPPSAWGALVQTPTLILDLKLLLSGVKVAEFAVSGDRSFKFRKDLPVII